MWKKLKSWFMSATKPQRFMWLGMLIVAFFALVLGSTTATSSNWFCTEPCHNVHYDNTLTFNAGSHIMISCAACHEPFEGGLVALTLAKIEVAPDLIPTILGTYPMPLNENHSVALEMDDKFCTQCHNLDTRVVNASYGIIIDHTAHTDRGITCASCHNRVAHPEEGIEYTQEGNRHHEDWMTMDACYRCHGLEEGAQAPGECEACHTEKFDLVPMSHDAAGWYEEFGESGGHAAAYTEEASRVVQAETWVAGLDEVHHSAAPEDLGYEQTVNTCYTCHEKQYCTDCHGGIEMPHPESFAGAHGELGLTNPEGCAKCHARSEDEAASNEFCNACHHPTSTAGTPWVDEHFRAVASTGASACFDCHNPTYCAACHVSGPEAAAEYMRGQAQ
ncbi:MAG: NapC/NirT family cytochrome c [Coriobacteriia bacterium]|nr:NapC/NirT family cytochrome c [Coriobacteriia bacterium]MBN2839508.1 NapC/NirT family cytochrome c [Coriobacteriia bacterium]